jgi:DisA bacterial checkpoint controller nucleotide-binding
MIGRLIRNRQETVSPVEALYSRLFVGRPLCKLSPRLVCDAAALDGAVVIDENGIVRGVGCIFETQGIQTTAEGARTRAAVFALKEGVALKISQDGEMSIFTTARTTQPSSRQSGNIMASCLPLRYMHSHVWKQYPSCIPSVVDSPVKLRARIKGAPIATLVAHRPLQ